MKNLKEKLVEAINEEEINIEDFFEGARYMYSILDEKLDMKICFDSIYDQCDYYVYCTYYSSKIGKTIILDYSVNNSFDSAEELADAIIEYEKEANELEEKLPNLRK